jgi:glycosyltransferase involved in cell wall biosynthesis
LSGKPYIVHCHGTDIRLGVNWLKKRSLKKAKKVLVSTPDMLEILPGTMWLPNPVDTERFKQLKKHDGNKVLYFPHWYEDISTEARRICEEFGYDLTVQRFYSVPYEQLHLFLNEYDIFIDRYAIKSYSKTALEAMACGLAVVGYRHDLERVLDKLTSQLERKNLLTWQNENILPQHSAKAVVNKLIEVYQESLKPK